MEWVEGLDVNFQDDLFMPDVISPARVTSAKDAAASVSIAAQILSCRCLAITSEMERESRPTLPIIKGVTTA